VVPSRERPSAPRIAVVAIAVSFAFAIAVGVLRTVNAEPAERAVEVAGNVAFAAVFALPGLLALLGLRRRPSLLVAAGVLDLVLAFATLITLIGLAFVVPATMFFTAAGRMGTGTARPWRSTAAVLVGVVLGASAFFVLFANEDPVCWATNPATGETFRLDPARFVHGSSISMDSRDLPAGATGSGCSSDSISSREALAAAGIIVATLVAVWMLAAPTVPSTAPAASRG
jgi:hypothetical protein